MLIFIHLCLTGWKKKDFLNPRINGVDINQDGVSIFVDVTLDESSEQHSMLILGRRQQIVMAATQLEFQTVKLGRQS